MYKIYIALLASLTLAACKPKPQQVEKIEGFALGTVYSVTVVDRIPDSLEQKLDAVFAMSESTMSVFNEGSLLNRLNRNETDVPDENIIRNLELARRVSELSGGRYDITIQPLVEAYGFLNAGQADTVKVDSVLQYVGYDKIWIENGRLVKKYPQVRIDLNSIAKGYTVDMVAEMLDGEGVENYLVNIGGEMFCRGLNPKGEKWRIAVDSPIEGNLIQGVNTSAVIAISGVGVGTSGNYRNYHNGPDGKKYTHIINPLNGESTEGDLLSATVVAESCAMADALGTMFIALGMEEALKLLAEHTDIAALLIYTARDEEMRQYVSPAMKQYMTE